MYIRAHKTHTNITLGYPTVHTHRPLLMCPIKRKRVAKGLGNRRHCEAAERITTATGASLVSLSLFLSLTISVSIEGSPASHHYELVKMIHPPLLVAKLSSSFNGVGENKCWGLVPMADRFFTFPAWFTEGLRESQDPCWEVRGLSHGAARGAFNPLAVSLLLSTCLVIEQLQQFASHGRPSLRFQIGYSVLQEAYGKCPKWCKKKKYIKNSYSNVVMDYRKYP